MRSGAGVMSPDFEGLGAAVVVMGASLDLMEVQSSGYLLLTGTSRNRLNQGLV